MIKNKILTYLLIFAVGMSVFTGCSTGSNQEKEAGPTEEETASEEIAAGGWLITVEAAAVNRSLSNVSVQLGYTGLETSDYQVEAEEGREYCLVKLLVKNDAAEEDFQWDKLILTDGDGNAYHRMEDDFIADLDMMRMSGADLNFGENEGWIAYEILEGAENLTLSYAFESGDYETAVTPADDLGEAVESTQDQQDGVITCTETYEAQTEIDASLADEAARGYSFQEPNVIVDPYGTSPLTAVVIFTTEESVGGTITVKGKSQEDDITGTIKAATEHIIPVYGLYNGETTQVELALENGETKTLEITTQAQDVEPGEISVEMIHEEAYDYSQLTMTCSAGGTLYALDSKGDIRWFYNDGGALGVHTLENGHMMVPTSYTLRNSYYKSGIKEIDLTGKVYREYAIPGGMHHDFYELDNGNYLVASDSQDFSTLEDYVVEIDGDNGEVVWELNMADILDPTDGASASNLTDGGEEVDWFHNNGLWYDEENDLLLLSARHVDAIVAINKTEKTLAWILGDPTGWESVDEKYFFTPTGDDFEWQYAQHNVTMLDNGDIMLFDNGTAKVKEIDADNRVTGDEVYSRAVIYRIDTEAMTIEQVYEYGKERGPEWYSDWISGVVSLDGTQDNLWITAGSNLYNAQENRHDYYPSDMFQEGLVKTTHMDLVSDGELAYEITVTGDSTSALTYRSFRMPLYRASARLNVTYEGRVLGSLGVKDSVEGEFSLEDARELESSGWTFHLDETKFTVAGSYTTETAAKDLKDGLLILDDGDTTKAYAINQVGTDGEENTTVNVTGWTSVDDLEGSTYEIYLMLDGELYSTGNSVEITHSIVHTDSEGVQYYGYYEKAAEVSPNVTDLTLVNGNDSAADQVDTNLETEKTQVAQSEEIDDKIEKELDSGDHTWEDPLVLNNPFKIAPLTSMVVFTTEESCRVRVTVRGKEEANDITGVIDADTRHRVPVVGLYGGMTNTVVLELLDDDDQVTDTREIAIETEPLGDYFDDLVEPVTTSGESAFGLTVIYGQQSTYPYAIDAAGDVRWYLKQECGNYGIFQLSNNHFMYQDNEAYIPTFRKPQSAVLYEMDYLGRSWQLYYIANGFHHEVKEMEPGGNLLVTTNSLRNHEEDSVVELDRETGEEVKRLDLIDIFGEDIATREDWAHLNTASYDAEDHTVLLSARNLHAGIKINWDTMELVWILSNPEIWEGTGFEDYVLQPSSDFNWHYMQHTVYEVESDLDGDSDTLEISMYDNHWQDFSKVDCFDGLTNSYAKVYSIDEENMTVDLLKEFESELSYVTSNTIYDADSNHIFAMSTQLRDPADGRRMIIYEYDYDTGEIMNQYSIKKTAYRAHEMVIDWNDLASPLTLEDNYIKGNLKPLLETDEEIQAPTQTSDELPAMKLVGDVLHVTSLDHRVSQVIFKGEDHTYVYDGTATMQLVEDYLVYESDIVMPTGDMESDDYQIWIMYEDEFYDTGYTLNR